MNVENKKFYFFFILRKAKEDTSHLLVILSTSKESQYTSIVTPASYKAPTIRHCYFDRNEAEWRDLMPIQFPAASPQICTIRVLRL